MRALLVLVLLVVCGAAAPAHAADWQWPLAGEPAVSRPFAAPAHRYAAGHRGADLPGAPGAPVLAAGDGVVSYAGLVAGRGVIAVVHGALRTTYEPVSALVGIGQPVAAGEVLGTLEPGHAGCPVLACLHWGLRRGDDYLDPVRLVRPGPVRLLPLDGPAPVAALRAGGVPPEAVAALRAAGVPAGPAVPAAGGGPGRGPSRLGRSVPAPAAASTATSDTPEPTEVAVAAAAASVLGTAAVGALRRRRSPP